MRAMSPSFQVEGVRPDTKTLLNMASREARATVPAFFNMELVIPSRPSTLSTSSLEMAAESSAEEIGSINKVRAASLKPVAGTPRADGSGGSQDILHGSYEVLNLVSKADLTKSAIEWGSVDSNPFDSRASMLED